MNKKIIDACAVIRHDSKRRNEVWKEFLAGRPRPFYIRRVLQSVPELRGEAWEALRAAGPHKSDLIFIMRNIEELREVAGIEMIERYKDVYSLLITARYVPEIFSRVAILLQDKHLDQRQLRYAIRWVSDFRPIAAHVILNSKKILREDLRRIIKYVPEHAEEAGERLFDTKLSTIDYFYIGKYVLSSRLIVAKKLSSFPEGKKVLAKLFSVTKDDVFKC